MKRLLQYSCVLMAVVFMTAIALAAPFATMADETAPAQDGPEVRNGWIDENLGPGVARWVDENGNVSDQPGKQKEETGPDDQFGGGEQRGQTGNAEETAGQQQKETGQEAAEEPQKETGQEVTEEQQEAASKEGEEAPEGRQIDPAKPMVSLTFDDGPYAPVGNQIMDCLAQYGGKATFFVVGKRAAAYQAELQRMAAEGHEIGNHTYSHKYLTKLSGAQIRSQISRCNDAVQAACGVRPALVRLPGGLKNSTVLANVQAPMIMWSIDTQDWKTRNAAKSESMVLSQVRDGDIVLMHELYSQSGAAALEIIPRLTQAGYQLVTVSEMAQFRGGVAAGGVYFHF